MSALVARVVRRDECTHWLLVGHGALASWKGTASGRLGETVDFSPERFDIWTFVWTFEPPRRFSVPFGGFLGTRDTGENPRACIRFPPNHARIFSAYRRTAPANPQARMRRFFRQPAHETGRGPQSYIPPAGASGGGVPDGNSKGILRLGRESLYSAP